MAEPDDLTVNHSTPHMLMTGFWSQQNICMVLMADGSIKSLSSDISDEELRALFTINGGEPPQGDQR